MRTELIKKHVTELSRILGGIKPLIPTTELLRLYEAKKYTDMVRFVRNSMGLYLNIRVGYVNNGGPANTPAWVNLPNTFPTIGSAAFNNLTLTMYIRKSFLEIAPFESVVLTMAHEMAHIILGALGSSLATNEEATDLTAMIFGYSQFFVDGCLYLNRFESPATNWSNESLSSPFFDPTLHELGYLSPDEMVVAAEIIKRTWIFQTMEI